MSKKPTSSTLSVKQPTLAGNRPSASSEFLEVSDTLPKKEYYRSLRPNTNFTQQESIYGTLTSKDKSASGIIFKPSGKQTTCTVGMLDGADQTFTIDKASLGQQLFDVVCESIDLVEKDFFGISFRDTSKTSYWLAMDKKISKQITKGKWHFEFLVKYYPADIDTLSEDLTRYYLCLQVRQDLINGTLRCTFWSYVILGAYIVQSETGDFDPGRHLGVEYVKDQPFAPTALQTKEMLDRIVEMHKLHKGLAPEEADKLFLRNAVKLSLYGVDFHRVSDNSGDDLKLGVYYGGVLIYREYLRIKRISWAKIVKLSYRSKEFLLNVRPSEGNDTSERQMVFKCRTADLSKRLYQACQDHHRFFRLREQQAPKKPQLSGFVNRQYKIPIPDGRTGGSSDDIAPRVIRQAPEIKRKPTVRKKPVEEPVEALVAPHAKSENIGTGMDDVDSNKPKPRPTFPHVMWSMAIADATIGLGIDERGLDVASQTGGGWQGVRANNGLKGPGNFYFETTVLEEGPVMIGWANNEANIEPIGSDSQGWALGLLPGESKDTRRCVLFHGNKKVVQENTMPTIQVNDVVGCLLNWSPDGGEVTMQWTINGKPVFGQKNLPKVADTMRRDPLFPATSLLDSRVEVNFGDSPFLFPPSAALSPDRTAYIPCALAADDCMVSNHNQGCRMNPYDATEAMEVAPNGLGLQSESGKGWQGCRSNKGVFGSGKYYYEATPLEGGPGVLARLGWCTEDGSLDLGSDRCGFGYGADHDGFGISGQQGKKLHSDEIENYGDAYTKGDVIGCFIDLNTGTISWAKNGKEFGKAYDIPSDLLRAQTPFFAAASLKDNTVDFNFGERPFKYLQDVKVIPLFYAPDPNTRYSHHRGPEFNLRYNEASKNSTEREEEELSLNNGRLRRPDQSKESRESVPEPDNDAQRVSVRLSVPVNQNRVSSTHITIAEGVTKKVEEGDPEEETETYIDEDGNLVRRTQKKKVTTTTLTTTKMFVEKSENLIQSEDAKFTFRTYGFFDDDDDKAFTAAIIAITGVDVNMTVLENSLHGGFMVDNTTSRLPIIESDI